MLLLLEMGDRQNPLHKNKERLRTPIFSFLAKNRGRKNKIGHAAHSRRGNQNQPAAKAVHQRTADGGREHARHAHDQIHGADLMHGETAFAVEIDRQKRIGDGIGKGIDAPCHGQGMEAAIGERGLDVHVYQRFLIENKNKGIPQRPS